MPTKKVNFMDSSPEEYVAAIPGKAKALRKKLGEYGESVKKGSGIKNTAIAASPIGVGAASAGLLKDKTKEVVSKVKLALLRNRAMEETSKGKSKDWSSRSKGIAERATNANRENTGTKSAGASGPMSVERPKTPKRFYRMKNGDIHESGTGRKIGDEEWKKEWAGQSTEVNSR